MPVDQWGNVIFTDELTKSGLQQNVDERERKRQGALAQYLQQQGMAPGQGTDMPKDVGPEFAGFLKSGGLKEYAQQEREKRSGMALADVYQGMSKDPKMKQYEGVLQHVSSGLRSGGLTTQEAQTTLKPILERAMLPQETSAGPEGLLPETLHTMAPQKRTKMYDEKTGLSKDRTLAVGKDEMLAGHINFLNFAKGQGIPENDPRVQWSQDFINRATPPITAAPDTRILPGMARGGTQSQTTPSQGIQPIISRPPTESSAEVEKASQYNTYINQAESLASDLKTFHENLTPRDKAMLQSRLFLMQHDPTGLAKTLYPLPPEMASLDNRMQQLVTDYEQTKGGVRAVAQQQAQQRLSAVHGGSIANPNSWISVSQLAQFMRDNRKEEARIAPQVGRRPMPQPTPAANPVEKIGQGTGPTPEPKANVGTPGSAGVSGQPMSFKEWQARKGVK